jgi:hypothetical protein
MIRKTSAPIIFSPILLLLLEVRDGAGFHLGWLRPHVSTSSLQALLFCVGFEK